MKTGRRTFIKAVLALAGLPITLTAKVLKPHRILYPHERIWAEDDLAIGTSTENCLEALECVKHPYRQCPHPETPLERCEVSQGRFLFFRDKVVEVTRPIG